MKAPMAAAATLALGACSLLAPCRHLRLVPPPLPERWTAAFGEIGLAVRVSGAETVLYSTQWAPIELDCPVPANTAVTLHPVVRGRVGLLLPAGAVYPADCSPDPLTGGETLQASWERGFTAAVLVGIADAGGRPDAVGLDAFEGTLRRLAREDPWRMEPGAVAAALLAGDRGLDDLRAPLPAVLRIPSSELGPHQSVSWFSHSPLDPTVHQCEEGWLCVDSAFEGFLRLFADDGALCIDAWIDAEQKAWMLRDVETAPPSGSAGFSAPRCSRAGRAPQRSSPPSCRR